MFRGLFNTFIWIYMALKHSFSMPWCFATNQKFCPPPSPRPALLVILACSSLPQALPSELLALTNSPLATIAPAGFLPVCGHGYWGVKCSAHLSQKCSAAPLDSLTKSKSSVELYPAIGTVSVERAGCKNTWPERCKLSNYFFSSNSLQTASNLWIHPACNLKVHFLQRKNKLQK